MMDMIDLLQLAEYLSVGCVDGAHHNIIQGRTVVIKNKKVVMVVPTKAWNNLMNHPKLVEKQDED